MLPTHLRKILAVKALLKSFHSVLLRISTTFNSEFRLKRNFLIRVKVRTAGLWLDAEMTSQDQYRGGARISDWRPEDFAFWNETGKGVAQRNLWISVPALLLAFAVWMVWSTVVVKLNSIGFKFTTDQLFWLTSLPGLAGATLRIFYSFTVPIFGGRNWTVISTVSLLLPALGMGFAVQNPQTPYSVFVVLALLCGFGGGNFASSMSNINYFFPKSQKGVALGLNAGLGNLGVSVTQFLVPVVIGMNLFGSLAGGPQMATVKTGVTKMWLQNAGFVWVPILVITIIAAWLGMNNLDGAKASFADQSVIFKRKHNWIMCWLYLGTFGSFIGYSAAFPLLIKTQFASVDPLKFAFIGPMVGALMRPVGGWISDKWGGARVTFWTFLMMIVAVCGVLYFLENKAQPGAFQGFFILFLVLFSATGVGNASTFRMIPVIMLNAHAKEAQGKGAEVEAAAMKNAAKESGAILGFSSAIAAYGAFIIPKSYGYAIEHTGGPQAALWGFVIFYVTCVAITWWFYSRRGAEAPC